MLPQRVTKFADNIIITQKHHIFYDPETDKIIE